MSTIKLLHSTIWSSPLMLILFIAAVGYLIYRIRKGTEPVAMLFLVIYSILTLILITYNPILPRFFNRFADDEYSYLRFAWIVPIYFLMAYAGMKAVMSMRTNRSRIIAAVLAAVLIVAAGEPRPEVYLKAENAYKLDSEIVELCDAIIADSGMSGPTDRSHPVRVLVQTRDDTIYEDGSRDNRLYFGIRQYAEALELTMGRVDDTIIDNDDVSYENSSLRNGYRYLFAENIDAIKQAAEEIGYVPLAETENYMVMKSDVHTRIWLVRHAETEANEKGILAGSSIDLPLTEKGIEDTVRTGEALKDLNVSSVYSSVVRRTWRTAAIIQSVRGEMDMTVDEAAVWDSLDEANASDIGLEFKLYDADWGVVSEKTLTEAIEEYGIKDVKDIFGPVEDENYVSYVPVNENSFAIENRYESALSEMITKEAAEGRNNSNVLVVCHSAMNMWIDKVIPEARGIELPNSSVTVLDCDCGEWSVLAGPMTDPDEIREAVEEYGL